jgi:hypothetical protein
MFCDWAPLGPAVVVKESEIKESEIKGSYDREQQATYNA